MSRYQYHILNTIFFIFYLILTPVCRAELVSIENAEISNCPVEKNKVPKVKKKKKRRWKKPEKTEDVSTSLYLTFALMMMLPLFVIIGILLISFGFPFLSFLITGIGLIVLGNGATIGGGATAGASKVYSTQVLSFALWFFFGINLVGSIVFLTLALTFFAGGSILWILAAFMLALALFMLIWVLIIRKQNKGLRNQKVSSTSSEIIE